MTAFLLRRLAAGALTLLAIATLCFAMTRLAPGSPFTSERTVHPEILRNFERHYGLDRPLPVQYARALWGYLRGDLGPSMWYRDLSCNDIVWPGFRNSLVLGLLGAVLAFLIGLPLGILAAAHQNRWPDHAAMTVSIVGICVPNFLLGPLLVLLFSTTLGWLPAGRWPEDWTRLSELRKLLLPALTLAMVHAAYISRLGRAGMLDVLLRDYIRTARAKGLPERTVFLKHALKNGITPVLSYAGPMIAYLVTGSIVVETVFALPGLGQHFVTSAVNRDMPLLMACVLVYSTVVIAMNLAVDALYGILDPRVRVS